MKKVFSVLISNFILATIFADKVLAQEEFGVNDLADAGLVLGTRSIQETIAGIVNVFLGFLGILATLLILYAGYLWMTSRGNADKVEKAKLLLASAVIGLVIIVSAYAISRFLLGRLYEETGPNGPGGGPGPGPGGLPTCDEPFNAEDPLVCSLSRGSGPVGSGLTLRGWHFDTDGDGNPGVGRVEIGGVVAEVVECAGSAMWEDRRVKVKIPDVLDPGNYEVILYNDFAPGLASVENPHFDFTVLPGVASVNIDCLVPDEEAVTNLPVNVQILGNGFTDTQDNVSMTAWVAGAETPIDLAINSWSDLEINVTVPGDALSSDIVVSVGANFDQEFFNVTCANDPECTSGCCSDNACVDLAICQGANIPGENAPVIQSISPEDGEEGSLVTIFGYNFGNDPGTVTFEGTVGDLPSVLSGGACIDVWTNEYIVMGVPVGANGVLDVVVTQAAGAGGESSDPYIGFDRNDTVRPGLCSLSTDEGQYGDVLDITGINFVATDQAYFDTVLSYDTNIISANSATAEVPNVVGNLGVSLQTVADVSSNFLPFSALAIGGGGPIINELSPDNGPVDSYVTIMGSNFGDNDGLVLFDVDNDPDNGNEVPGSFDFPVVCGDYWFDNYIIVKVPAGPWVIGNDYPIRVQRNPDGALSNDFDFTITDVEPGPQICSVSPDNGPIGNLVTISGENFGSNLGSVLFYNAVPAVAIDNWSANQIFDVEIPVGAVTGPLVVRDSAGNDSNGVAFSVGACSNDLQCGVDVCCAGENGNYCAASCDVVLNACEYTWEVSTQADPFELYYNYSCVSGIQSPSPWPDQHEGIGPDGFIAPQPSLDAFIDSNISALFTRNVEDVDFNTNNVQVWECGNGADFEAGTCANQIFDNDGILEIINHNTDREGFTFNPTNNLLANRWYQVRLGTFNAEVGADSWTPDPVDDAWHFKTRDSDVMCEVSTVAVTPQSPQANMYPGREKNFTASPLADNCNICGGDYDWQWSLGPDPNPISATIVGPFINMSVNQGYTRIEGGPMSTQLVTDPNHITLIAENSNYGISGESYPIILAPILRVEDNVPSCSDSCTNVAVWVDFNTTLLGPLNINDFAIYQCLDADCSGWDAGTNYTTGLDSYEVPGDGVYRVDILHDSLPANENYIVIIDETVTNIHGYPLGADYRWDFGVSDTNCIITGADILPDNYTANSLNDINYRGYALAEAGSCGTQAIQCENCSWNWGSSNNLIATILPGGAGERTVPATPVANGNTNINLEIDGTPLGLGSANASTPLTVDVAGAEGNFVDLAVSNYFPNCGACTNSIAELWFNSDLQPATVNVDSIQIFDITANDYDVLLSPPTIIGRRHVILDHGDFDMGHSYRIEVDDTVLNTSNDNIEGGWGSPDILIEQEGCLADAAWVDPVVATAGRNDTVAYRAVTTYDAPACGPSPVNCETCIYDWQNNILGNFDQMDSQFPIFTTLDTVNDGDSAPMTLNVWEGANALPVTDGTLNIDLSIDSGDPLNIIGSWPDCDGACGNSQVGVRFNTAIEENTLVGQYSITDATGDIFTSGYTLTGGNRILIIEHFPLVLGDSYSVSIGQGIENEDGNTLAAPFSFDFTVGEAECKVTSVNVNPDSTTAGASQGITYNVETLANTVSCGNLPVYCATCTYAWSDLPQNLGDFNNATSQNTIFTTAPTVINGDVITIEADVLDQGTLFEDSGQINIVIGPTINPTVDLIGFFPPDQFLMCINAVPYFEFDISSGDLDRQSLIDQAVFLTSAGAPVNFSVKFLKLNPGILTAVYEPNDVLEINTSYFFGFADLGQVRAQGGGPVGVNLPQPLDNYLDNVGRFLMTTDDECPIHHIEIYPKTDSFTCIDNNGCDGDEGAMAGNQHLYQSVVYDIQNNILGPALSTYTWSSSDNNIVDPESFNDPGILGTAGDNGIAHLNLEVFLNTDPANVFNSNNTVEVNTCQNPWPNLATYPWNDNTLPDMNFSTYYCEEYGTPGETVLPHMDIPNIINSPDPNVIREYISTIEYPMALNGASSYLGSLAYNEKSNDSSWTKKLITLFKPERANSQGNPTVDIIAFRVMSNPEHLSIGDWYTRNAPNPEGGQLMTVNGYEAMQVGASIYIAATNVEGGSIYTNVYIIAHNIGANATTLEIYNQLVENFKLNTNINTFTTNTCRGQTALSCSSDFDCPNYCDNFSDNNQVDCLASGSNWFSDVCDSSLLKLRRDTKRLSDLVNINEALLAYGEIHKACANNSLISCQNSSDCPSNAACVPYYPPLNSGTYLNGASNTRWPSWQETLSGTLGYSLPEDPINLFNGCSDPYNPQTCWEEQALEFICPANSLIYMYNIEGIGQSYYLGAKFEFDMQNPAPPVTFANNLNNPVSMDLDINTPHCDAMVLNPPGASASPYCGNGVIDADYCSEPVYDNQADCLAAGADWIVSEECDNEFWRFACSESPPTANPPIPTVGNHEWWREQTIGCNPPGTINGAGDLIECTWYRPNPPIAASQCGGYCGDGTRQPYYERCDGVLPPEPYHCAEAGVNPYCANCQVLCNNGTNIYPAALCGDGIWSQQTEQCDPTANPNGNAGWDCTDGGNIGCSSSCQRTCTVGTPYPGLCGDGAFDPANEECDYSNYTAPLPVNSSAIASYGCTLFCEMNGEFCGDGVAQYEYQELCDWNGAYNSPDPLFSDEFHQYGCRADDFYTALNGVNYGACTATLDGWCGDGNIQDGATFPDYGEECDPGSPWDGIAQNPPAPLPENSSVNNQYSCDVDCVGRIGGYCGDNAANEPFEVCDGADYPNRPIPFFSGPNNTYACADDCSGGAVDGGYCGDGTKNSNYYESCDWGPENNQDASSYPWPRGNNLSNFSSEMNQYLCSSCINFGGWCGNGVVDGACNVNCADCDQNGNNCQSTLGCSEFQCQAKGGTFFPYEQCDNGYDPAYLVNKNVDIVYIMDTSGSMQPAAENLCLSTATVVNTLNTEHPDINYRITIFPLGDGDASDGGYEITATENDNIQHFFQLENIWNPNIPNGTDVGYDDVFNYLYSDCLATTGGLLVNPATGETIDPRVRYRSIFDDATNDINGPMDIYAGDTVNQFCPAYDATENWGYAIKRIAEDYNWLDGYHRIIVPVSDEHAVCGGGTPQANENFVDTDGVYDILAAAVDACTIDPSNPVFINPVLLSRPSLIPIGNAIADATGGLFTNSSMGWEVQTLQVINSTICDGVGGGPDGQDPDGHMDCVLDNNWDPAPPPPVPPCRVEGQYCSASLPCCAGPGLFCNAASVCEAPAIPPPMITSPLVASGAPNQPFTYTITATNNPTSYGAANLPAGLSINTATGVISGSTAVLGTRLVTISATNGTGTDSETLNLTIAAVPVITSPLASTGTSGQPFTYTITATNNPIDFNAEFLPAGLSINPTTGIISGTTLAVGVYNVTISASNNIGSDTETLVITILAPIPVITSQLAATVPAGQAFSYTITASGNPTSFNAVGLPAGLAVNTSTGVISGTPTIAGTYNVTISATNGSGTGSATLVLTVTLSAPVITSANTATATLTRFFAYLITATNSPTSFNAVGLPAGLSINTSTGVISGTPTATGVYSVTISATNAAGTGTRVLTITVNSCSGNGQSCSAAQLCCSGYSCSGGNCLPTPERTD